MYVYVNRNIPWLLMTVNAHPLGGNWINPSLPAGAIWEILLGVDEEK